MLVKYWFNLRAEVYFFAGMASGQQDTRTGSNGEDHCYPPRGKIKHLLLIDPCKNKTVALKSG
jgi:hypothetical protein